MFFQCLLWFYLVTLAKCLTFNNSNLNEPDDLLAAVQHIFPFSPFQNRSISLSGKDVEGSFKPLQPTGRSRFRARLKVTEPKIKRGSPTKNTSPTPAPSGDPHSGTTVHIADGTDFALLMPSGGEMISDAENDGSSYCSESSKDSTCLHHLPVGFIRASSVSRADDDSWIQVTGCMDSSKYPFASGDDGGQFDVRFPNGAQCTFGGYGASFIQQLQPTANRFCLRCCSSPGDQENCNSHQDRAGCPVAVPGVYDFPNLGVRCS
ncbi:hypothetical protein JAAARDRAFT_62755 [Jaapia argillacea MUCL 33604]|uniref:Uncharacterized protein n=1 Tax=Jaapia argillacea MUCL 33604 TaxID=933084 RepID=A0A067PL40_9AGAM|nr:hypothetical protein JAAARDRAFT_62755 [Jaapia argillacea MUCL 33604]